MPAKCVSSLLLATVLLLGLNSGLSQALGPAPQTIRPHAAIVVNTLEDEFNSDGDCSLREAIAAANFNAPQDACPGGDSSITDTITFAVGGTIVLGLELPHIQDAGPLTIDGGDAITISGNHSVRPFYVEQNAQLTLQNLAVIDGLAVDAMGGGATAVMWGALVSIANCTFSGNHSDVGGGAISANTSGPSSSASIVITSTNFYSNTADGVGGAIEMRTGSLSLNNCVLAHNTAGDQGGSIFSSLFSELAMQGCTVASNSALYGGGIMSDFLGDVQISQSLFVDNLAAYGGGVYASGAQLSATDSNFTGNTATQSGGGIESRFTDLDLRRDLFFDNTAGTTGGGLYNEGNALDPRSQRIANTTFSANTAGWGGAIFNITATLGVTNTTLAYNQASHNGDALYDDVEDPGAIHLWNTVVAYGLNDNNCSGAIVDEGHNIDSGTTCAFDPANASWPNTDPLLGPLGDYGGLTSLHPLFQGSPALNRANAALCPPTDQRGFPRRAGYCDVGAFEAQPTILNMVQAGNNQSTLINTLFPIPLGVEAADPYENPLGGVPVTFIGPSSGPGIANSGTTLITGENGQVAFNALANSTPGGPYLVYGTDPAAGLTSPGFALTNLPYNTATTITGDAPDPSLAGQQFDVAFQVTSAYGTPGGYVDVTVTGRPETCTGALSGGEGWCNLSIAAPGDYTLVATYSGYDTFGPSSGTAAHTVNTPQPRDTVTTITADTPDPSQVSQIFTVTFQVAAASDTPTGIVVVEVSGGLGACSSPLGGGIGSCPLSLVDVGDYTLVATYQGDADHDPSSDTEPHRVVPAGSVYAVYLPLIVK